MAKTPQTLHADIERHFPDNEAALITPEVTRDFLHDLVEADRGPNATVGGTKYVIYLTHAEAVRAGQPTYASLDQVKPSTVVLNNLACVNLFPGGSNVWLQAVYDDGLGPYPFGPGFAGIADGTGQLNLVQLPGTGLLPMKWVLKDSVEAATANVALYKAGKEYHENDLVRGLFGTFPNVKSVVFYANESGTAIPAPSRPEGDAYWSVFNPAPAPYAPWQTVTPDELRKLQAQAKLSAGRLYIVTPRLIADDPEDRAYPDLFIRALLESQLEPTGHLLVGANDKPLVTYDLATDTTTPVATTAGGAPQWVAGKQTAEALVWWQGKLYRVKQTLISGQVPPNGNPDYYELMSDPALVAQHTQLIASNTAAITTLGPLTKPFYVTDTAGRVGYDTLAAALTATRTGSKSLNSNVATATLTGLGITSPGTWYGDGNRVVLADGATLRLGGAGTVYGLLVDATTATGAGTVQLFGLASEVFYTRHFVDCALNCVLRPNGTQSGAVVLRGNTSARYADATAGGPLTVYLYDTAQLIDGYNQATVTVVDCRPGASGGGGGSPAADTYQAQTDSTNAYNDLVLTKAKAFTLDSLVNASGFQAQALHTESAAAWGPVRTVATDLTADLAAAFGAGAAATVVLRVSAVRIDAARRAFVLFSLS